MSNFSSVSPEEAKAVWDRLTNPSLNGVHKALRAAGRRVSLQTIANWKKNGWSRQSTAPSPMDTIEQLLPAVVKTGEVRAAQALSFPELDEVAAASTMQTETDLDHYIQANMHSMDRKQLADLTSALARLRAANIESSDRMAKRAGETVKVISGTEIPPWVRTRGGVVERWEDDPLHDDIESIGGPLPDAKVIDPYWGQKYGRTPEQVKKAYEEARQFEAEMEALRMVPKKPSA